MCYDDNARPPVPEGATGAAYGKDLVLEAADGNRFTAYLARPSAPASAQVLILPDIRGLHQFYKDLALRFAEIGVAAIAMDYFGRTAGLTARDDSFEFMPHVQQTKPTTLFADVGAKCGEEEGDIHPDQDVYWYVWAPSKRGCNADKTTAKVTITKVLPAGGNVRPEYDRLVADRKIDALVIFGQVGHGAITDSDYAFTLIRSFEASIKRAGFQKKTAEVGLRYTRVKANLTETIDIYSPREFAGLGDYAHFDNFDRGLNSHEIVVYNGHSMLGASDFWARESIYMDPTRYQIFIYNGCLGYQYYVNPILEGKQSWDNVDLVSNITETPFAIMVQETSNAISMLMAGAERGGTTTWNQILTRMNELAGGDAFYGASGVRTNRFMR